MTIAYDASSRNGTTWVTASTSMTWAHTVGTGGILIVEMGTYDGGAGDQCTGVTFNGDALTKVTGLTGSDGATNTHISSWVLLTPDVGTYNIVASFSATIDYMCGFGKSYTGVKAVDAYATATGTSTAPAISVTTVADNCWVTGMAWSRSSGPSAGTNTTMRQTTDALFNSADTNAAQTPAGAHALNWTTSNGLWWTVGVSLEPATTPINYLKGRPRNRYDFTGVSLG